MADAEIQPATAAPALGADAPLPPRGPHANAGSMGHTRCCASGPRPHSVSGLHRYCASGACAEAGRLALNCFTNFSDLI
jgi:hypothetical protein